MAKSPGKQNFEAAIRRLDEIVEQMESGEIGIEESIARYEEAMRLAAYCRQVLDQAEQRVKQIQIDAAGRVSTTPFAPAEPPPEDASDDAEA